MVDKAVYVSNSGTENLMHRMEILTNNLANSSTTGFKADYSSPTQTKVGKDNTAGTRIYSGIANTWSDFSEGPVTATGRDLDVALNGKGFIAVQSASGREGYTRAGNLHIRDNLLVTGAGQLVIGTSGVISIPAAAERVSLSSDGTVTAKIRGATDPVRIGRIKLVNPAIQNLQKGDDGLIYPAAGQPGAQQDNKVRLTAGALEGSNVNAVKALTDLVDLSRQFEMQSRLMKAVQENADHANQVMVLPAG